MVLLLECGVCKGDPREAGSFRGLGSACAGEHGGPCGPPCSEEEEASGITPPTWHVGFIIPFSSRRQFGFLCAASLSPRVATHCGADPEGERQLPEQMQLSVVSGGCKCSLWELFDVADPTLNQEEEEEETVFSTICISISANDLCLGRCKCKHFSKCSPFTGMHAHCYCIFNRYALFIMLCSSKILPD